MSFSINKTYDGNVEISINPFGDKYEYFLLKSPIGSFFFAKYEDEIRIITSEGMHPAIFSFSKMKIYKDDILTKINKKCSLALPTLQKAIAESN